MGEQSQIEAMDLILFVFRLTWVKCLFIIYRIFIWFSELGSSKAWNVNKFKASRLTPPPSQ